MELSNKGMDATKRGTIGQAHLIHRKERHVFTVKARTQCTYLQSRQKQYADLQPNKSNLQALNQIYFTDKRHKHTYKTPKKRKEKRDLPCWPSSPPLPTVSLFAPGSGLPRGRRTLSGTPRLDAQVHHRPHCGASRPRLYHQAAPGHERGNERGGRERFLERDRG